MGATVQRRDGRLVLRVTHGGRRWPERTTWPDTPENYAKAVKYAAMVSAAIKAGTFGPEQYLHFFPRGLRAGEMRAALGLDQESTAQPTFDRYAAQWLERQTVKAKRFKELKTAITRLSMTEIDGVLVGHMRLRAITPAVLEAVRGKWIGQGLSMKSARNYLRGSLSGLFTTAVDADRVLKINPCSKVKWSRGQTPEPDPFTLAERDTIIGKLLEPKPKSRSRRPPGHRWAYPLIAILFWTGMRPSEATGLFWGDVELVGGRLFIRRSRVKGIVGPTKTEQSRRTIRLSARAVELLRDLRPLHPAEQQPVFTTPSGRPIDQDRFAKTHWRAALSAAEVRPRRLYDTRCTFISLAISGGVDLLWVSRQVGASVTTLERHYARYMPDADEVQLMRLNRALGKSSGENGPETVRNDAEGAA